VIDRVVDGLCAGGLRFAPDVSPECLRRLAGLMTLKFAVMGLRIGGAKAGIVGRRGGRSDHPLLLRAGELLKPHLEAGYLMGEDLGGRQSAAAVPGPPERRRSLLLLRADRAPR
jgi:glutamate dehydrogenase (NAD(P)+)